jgi:hypothetical protein
MTWVSVSKHKSEWWAGNLKTSHHIINNFTEKSKRPAFMRFGKHLGTVDLFWYYYQVPASKRVDSGSLYMKVLSWRGSTALDESGSWKQSCFFRQAQKWSFQAFKERSAPSALWKYLSVRSLCTHVISTDGSSLCLEGASRPTKLFLPVHNRLYSISGAMFGENRRLVYCEPVLLGK